MYRDVVEVRLDLGGIPCIVSDTAGLRGDWLGINTDSDVNEDGIDEIEKEGMRRSK
jgi:tRNA U34 5-carboxymethylaminomethyl modifying GTPase MnmE/TrmE